MHSQSPLKTALATCTILSLAPQAFAHMQMIWPYAIRSSYNPANNYEDIDYSMTSPLVADGSNFPCKGYQNDRPNGNVVTYTAGSTYNMSLAGSATHGGGSCQLSLSYDNGGTFRVIQSMIGGCPLTSTYNFTIPSYVPAGQALFAWSWQNLVGNREYYMNCADVKIVASTNSKRDASSTFSSFDDLPFIYKANLEGLNNCSTVETVVPVYPEPGPAVIYGTGATSSSAATSDAGVCDAPTPFGQTYEYPDDTINASTEVFGSTTASVAATSTQASSATTTSASHTTTLVTSSSKTTSSSSSSSSKASSSSKSSTLSTTTKASTTSSKASSSSTSTPSSAHSSSIVTLSTAGAGRLDPTSTGTCPPDVTLTVYADASTTTTGFLTPTKIATTAGIGSSVSTVLGFSTVSSSTILVVSAASSSAEATTTSSTTSSAAGAEVTEGYATGDLATYLPCVPGTFICTSDESWVTCDDTMYSDGSTAWIYEYNRTVASGMECVPNLSPYSFSTEQYAQQADTTTGYYRDDRIVAAQTYGTCSTEGEFECTDNGNEFLVCDNGAWVMMGAVAAGTTCENGNIVASS